MSPNYNYPQGRFDTSMIIMELFEALPRKYRKFPSPWFRLEDYLEVAKVPAGVGKYCLVRNKSLEVLESGHFRILKPTRDAGRITRPMKRKLEKLHGEFTDASILSFYHMQVERVSKTHHKILLTRGGVEVFISKPIENNDLLRKTDSRRLPSTLRKEV